ncbi:unnamed protein product, partial [Didymodactylos carnosus]
LFLIIMNFDNRNHDSGYFSPSPDSEFSSTKIPIKQMKRNLNKSKNYDNRQNDGEDEMINEKEKPNESYVALIARAILASPERRLLLNDIYDWIIEQYPYYGKLTGKAWRNSIRHNLSLNECFVRLNKAENGRGCYWGIHPANVDTFEHGDFRRRQARLRAKRSVVDLTKYPNETSFMLQQQQQQQQEHYLTPTINFLNSSSSYLNYNTIYSPSSPLTTNEIDRTLPYQQDSSFLSNPFTSTSYSFL